jgi:hypothetical protein
VDCERALNLVSARLDREIRPDDAADLDAHLAACPACRAAEDAFRLQDGDLRRAFAPRRAAAERVAQAVIARLPAGPTGPLPRLPWLPMLLSAAAGFLLAVLLLRPWQPPPPAATNQQQQAHTEQPPPPPPTVLLALATGAVEVLAPGQDAWQPLPDGGKVEVGSRVRTPPQVRCEFRTPDGSEVRLNGDTELAFRAPRQFDLAHGRILANVLAGTVPFEVQVADATVTALGTQFDLWSRPAETRLSVLDGQTKVRGPWGADTVVETGEVARIVKGQVPEKRQGENLLRETDWVLELLVLKRRDDKELTHRLNDILAQVGNEKASSFTDEEIRSLGYRCVLPLTRFLESERSQGQQFKRLRAARLIADLAQPWDIPDLIDLLADDDGNVRFYAARGLMRLVPDEEPLTPERWRDAPAAERKEALQAWRDWWEKNKGRYPKMP